MGKITVLRAGPLTTLQDLGRPNYRKLGIAPGGALDLQAARVSNLLAGNSEESALLEITLGPTRLRFSDERIVAWCGAESPARLAESGLPAGRSARVFAGENLDIGNFSRGCRVWLAISGGLDLPIILSSRATDLRGQFGGLDGRALRDGDELPLGKFSEHSLPANRISSWGAPAEWSQTSHSHPILRVIPGAEWDDFTPEAQSCFLQKSYTVGAQADRMGARLTGPKLLRKIEREIISEAVTPGTVQVANDRQPILLLGDCQTIGGYPKIAQVITVDLPLAAQLRPNDEVRFQLVRPEEARELFLNRESDLERFRIGVRIHAP
jgi:antagonist of KipI